jgi:hypothetical protein
LLQAYRQWRYFYDLNTLFLSLSHLSSLKPLLQLPFHTRFWHLIEPSEHPSILVYIFIYFSSISLWCTQHLPLPIPRKHFTSQGTVASKLPHNINNSRLSSDTALHLKHAVRLSSESRLWGLYLVLVLINFFLVV